MDLKSILKNNGIEEDKIGTIVEAINQEIPKNFVSKQQYNKKVNQIDDLQNQINDFEARQDDGYKSKFETLQGEFDTFKANIESEKTNATKSDLLKSQLKEDGANEKIINLLMKEFDLSALEIEENKIKGWEDLSKGVKESYADFFAKEESHGNPPMTPPDFRFQGAKDPFLEGFEL